MGATWTGLNKAVWELDEKLGDDDLEHPVAGGGENFVVKLKSEGEGCPRLCRCLLALQGERGAQQRACRGGTASRTRWRILRT
jgi:hypothetical protein